MISKRSDDATGYHTAAQTENREVVISACVEPEEAGHTVYFEVLDSDDPVDNQNEAYKERKNKTGDVKEPGDLMDEVDTEPNDNRDPNRTMAGGTLAKYNQLQSNALSSRSAKTIIKEVQGKECAVAEVTLTITNRYAGDRYRVRATCVDPEGKPFNQNSNVTAEGDKDQHADISESEIKSTVELVAWKRIYVETRRMFRVGVDLAEDAVQGQNTVKLNIVGTIGIKDKIQIFDTSNKVGEIHIVKSVDYEEKTIELEGNLSNTYTAKPDSEDPGYDGHVGLLEMDSDPSFEPFFVPATDDFVALWPEGFVEIEFRVLDAGVCPWVLLLDTQAKRSEFSRRWFSFYANAANTYHVIGARFATSTIFGAASLSFLNPYCYTFIRLIEDEFDKSEWDAVNRTTTVHELTHHYERDPTPGQTDANGHHVQHQVGVIPEDDGNHCIMNTGGSQKEQMKEPSRWCIFHVYAVRDQYDDLVD